MTLFLHELKRNRLSLIIWSAAVSFMLGVCVIIYPEMTSQMQEVSDVFSEMGAFSSAFGMDELNFGEFIGYFSIELNNTLGLGGAIFAAIIGCGLLAKEEKDGTAEFLLTHPVSRARIVSEKLFSAIAQILIFNLSVTSVSLICAAAIGETEGLSKLALLFVANLILQLEILSITLCVSAFVKRGGLGIGLGITLGFYFINIISNLSEKVEFLKFITPYAYTDGSKIVSEGTVEIKYLAVGLIFSLAGLFAAYKKYCSKDIT